MSTKRPPLAGMMLLVMGGAAAAVGQGAIETFDAGKAGQPPSGFGFAAMRQPSPGRFLVRRTDAGGHLVHSADTAATGFAFAISPEDPLSDVVVSVRLRLAGGSRAGGIVWRFIDARNFYAAVLDLGRAELSLYRVTDGNMIRIEQERELELDGEAWHSLKVVHDNADVRVSLGGIRVFTEDERRHSRLLARGRAGVVAAGAAEVWFDDLRIASGRNRR